MSQPPAGPFDPDLTVWFTPETLTVAMRCERAHTDAEAYCSSQSKEVRCLERSVVERFQSSLLTRVTASNSTKALTSLACTFDQLGSY